MVKTRLYLDCRRMKADNLGTLKIAIYKENVRALIPLDIKIPSDCWDAELQRPMGSYVDKIPAIEEKLNIVRSFIATKEWSGDFDGLRSCEIKDVVVGFLTGTPVEPRKERQQKPAPNNFKARFDAFANSRPAEGTRKLYRDTWTIVEKFAKHSKFDASKLTFEDITVRWLKDLDAFMGAAGNSRNYRNIHFRNLRAVFNDALDDEVTSCYPFRKFKIKAQKTMKRSLTLNNLRKLFDYEVEGYAEFYRDMFKLTFFLIGINPVDLANLEEITEEGRVEYNRAKTHRPYSIKVEPEALEIIERYRGKKKLLRIMDRWTDHRFFIHQMNNALKKVGAEHVGKKGKKVGGEFPGISSYWARHTWATIASSIDIPKDTIAVALGHGDYTVTDIYIKFELQKVDAANRRVMDWVLYGRR